MMTMTRMVMVRVSVNKIGKHLIAFRNSDFREPEEDRGHFRSVYIHQVDWEELGSPDEITVTIEPGDKLNV